MLLTPYLTPWYFHIFLASRAKEVGLIDAVGTLSDTKKALEKTSGVKKAVWKQKDKLE